MKASSLVFSPTCSISGHNCSLCGNPNHCALGLPTNSSLCLCSLGQGEGGLEETFTAIPSLPAHPLMPSLPFNFPTISFIDSGLWCLNRTLPGLDWKENQQEGCF